MLALDWRSFKAKGYTETGAGALNLQVHAQSAQESILKVGAYLQQQFSPQTQWLARAALGHDLRHQNNAVTARFTGGGVVFTTEGVPQSRTLAKLGFGIRRQTTDHLELRPLRPALAPRHARPDRFRAFELGVLTIKVPGGSYLWVMMLEVG